MSRAGSSAAVVRPLSAGNPLVARTRRLLRQSRARADSGHYVIEGSRLVLEAIEAGVVLDRFVVRAGAIDDPGVVEILGTATDTEIVSLPDGAFDRLSTTMTPQPALAVAASPVRDLDDVLATAPTLVMVLADVGDPGNAGTVLRVADATSAGGVVFCGRSVDPLNPKVVRAAAGALFRVLIVTANSTNDTLARITAANMTTLGTDVRTGDPYDQVDLTGPVAIVLGSEAHGLGDDVAAACDALVTIPMPGAAESLNVAMAGAVLAFEAVRQRRAASR